MKKLGLWALSLAVAAFAGGALAEAAYYTPKGFTLSPFLSDKPVHSFKDFQITVKPNTEYRAVIETSVGRMVLSLNADQTPVTVNSFVWLARHHFFDGITFHRVVPNFVVQAGDPNTLTGSRDTWGQGGPGYMFGLETRKTLAFDAKGVLGMARATDPNSNGSQFYITLAPTPNLNGQYTVFGKVVEGLAVLDKIAVGEPPAKPTAMTRVYIVQKAVKPAVKGAK